MENLGQLGPEWGARLAWIIADIEDVFLSEDGEDGPRKTGE